MGTKRLTRIVLVLSIAGCSTLLEVIPAEAVMTQVRTLRQAAPESLACFGAAVACSMSVIHESGTARVGGVIIAGAPFDDVQHVDQGSAERFRNNTGNGWPLLGTHWDSGGAANANFGGDVALDGSIFMGGAPGQNAWAGKAFRQPIPSSGGGFAPGFLIAGDMFGWSVDRCNGFTAVGAPFNDAGGINAGAVVVFDPSGGLQALNGEAWSGFGSSVAMHGDYLVVGAPTVARSQANSGSVFVYRRSGISWTSFATITPPELRAGNFGANVAINGDHLVIAMPDTTTTLPGRAYVYYLSASAPVLRSELNEPEITGGMFGASVAIYRGRILVGAPGADADMALADVGRAYVFEPSGGSWACVQTLTPSLYSGGDLFGASVAVSDQLAVVGAPGHDAGPLEMAGSIAVFEASSPAPPPPAPTSVMDAVAVPQGWIELRAGPNPTADAFTISYRLPEESDVTLRVYNVRGELVKALESGVRRSAGVHRLAWDRTDTREGHVPPGVYFLRIQAGDATVSRKIFVIE